MSLTSDERTPHGPVLPGAEGHLAVTAPARVVLGMSCELDDLDAALWASAYAKRLGHGLAVLRADDAAHEPADLLPAGSREHVRASTARALVAESRTADVVVVSSRTAADRALALVVAASAWCPVVVVPPGAGLRDDLPVLAGANGDALSEATLLAGFALARALNTGVRAVCCTREALDAGPLPTPTARAAADLVDRCARRYPDVPVDTRVARSQPVTGLTRHAGSASLLVVGCTPTTEASTSRRLLDRCAGPVALVGPRVAVRATTPAEVGR
ncbi:universal stress protein [Saccharothrix sp. BKS2]|uniref:hypothetical protein n=1 Tax=Saccharothrix sp. BKS2 TaxID=3064400 RepID=UPI0039EB8ECC